MERISELRAAVKFSRFLNVLIVGMFCTLLFSKAQAQSTESTATVADTAADAAKNKKVTMVPLPILGANPTTGFIVGFSPGFYWTMGAPKTTSMSSALGYILYTTNQQFFISLRSSTFLKDDRYFMLTDARFALNSQPTYGLGSNPEFTYYTTVGGDDEVSDNPYNKVPRKEMIAFNHIRLYNTLFKRFGDSRFFAGVGYHLDHMYQIDDQQLDLSANPPVITFHEQHQRRIGMPTTKYTQSGLSANLLFDSRDNVANPYKGQYAFASLRLSPEFLGSTANNSQLWLEYRTYINLNKNRPRNLLALWGWGWFQTGGKIPYMFLPATGWDMFGRSGRPYTLGRFRGEDVIYTEAEWRFPLPIQKEKDRWGGVIFVNASTASNRAEKVGVYDYTKLGYGLGLRYMLSPAKRVNVSLDYGWGAHGAQGLFLNLQEMF